MSTNSDLQVKPDHYDFTNYVTWPRWSSYWHQIAEMSEGTPDGVLYVGVGDGIVPDLLEKNGLKVKRFDFDAHLGTEYTGDVRQVDQIVPINSVDVVGCCQVLEHLPFECFEPTLRALLRVARKKVVISLPYSHRHWFEFKLKIPKIPLVHVHLLGGTFWKEWQFNGEHHWEIGAKGYSQRKIEAVIGQCGQVTKQFLAREHAYHMFYVIEK